MTGTQLSPEFLDSIRTQTGETLGELSRSSPVLVVFLRHCGCTFAREALADVASHRQAIQQSGAGIVIVHMQTDEDAGNLLTRYGLADLPRISDPDQKVYQAFELKRGSLWQVAGPGMWWRAVQSLFKGNLAGIPNADVYQLPGAFLVHHGQIVNAFRGRSSSDRPDYCELAQAGSKSP